MIIYIMRHGETDWNTKHLFQGRTDIPLNENGRKVAEWTRDGLRDIPFDAAFSSPLLRAHETAEIVLQGRNVDIITDNRLIEMAFGSYEGSDMNEWDDNLRNFFTRPELYEAPEGGETMEDVIARADSFLSELFADAKYADSTILLATHGAFLNSLLSVIKKNPIEKYWNGGLYKNCGFTVVEVTDGVPKILKEAITAY